MSYVEWINRSALSTEFSSEYWNSVEEEKSKPWFIHDANEIDKLWEYIKKNGYLNDYEKAVSWLKDNQLLKGRVLDVAAGVCWSSALLSKESDIDHVDALDFSYHRIHDIAPHVIKGMDGNVDKITRIFGSFYNIESQDMYDVIFMSQAFHHAQKPFELLRACDETLNRNGVIVLIGEHHITLKRYLRKIAGTIIREKRFSLQFYDLFKPDEILGDHYYRLSDYHFIFASCGYDLSLVKKDETLVMVAHKKK